MATTASTLDDLLKNEGVFFAGEFDKDGTLVDYKAKMEAPREMAALAAQYGATVTMLFDALAGSFTQLSGGMPWVPQQGWAYSGGQYTACVGGNRWVFVETDKADFNKLFEALIGPR
jgi:roadblock/LC7 domain-containing protein